MICSSYLELSGLRPKAASASRDLESFSMILPDCSHENKLFQKDWVFSHVQNRCNRCSVSFRQKVHFSLSVNPNLCKKLLVGSRRCRNLKIKNNNSIYLLLHLGHLRLLHSVPLPCRLPGHSQIPGTLDKDTSY